MESSPSEPDRITFRQWLAAAAIWALALYGLMAERPSADVRFAQADAACARTLVR